MIKWFGSSLKKNNQIKNQKWYVLDCFKRLSFFFIKKGKKKKINKNFKQIIFLQSNMEDFWKIIYLSLIKNTPLFYLKSNMKKKNLSNTLRVIPLKVNEQQKLGNLWLKDIVLKNNDKQFFFKLKKELIKISKDQSKLIEKQTEIYQNVYKKWEYIIKKKNLKMHKKNKRFLHTQSLNLQEMTIRLKSFSLSHLLKICKEIFNECRNNNLKFTNFQVLPKKSTQYTVLRSPHVNKTARDQFELKSYVICFKIFFKREDNILLFLQYLKKNTIGVEISYKIKN